MKNDQLSARVIFCAVQMIPLRARRFVFKALFILFYNLSLKHRLITMQNLTRSFPDKGPGELASIARESYMNLGIIAAEFFDITSMTKENVGEWLEFEGLDNYRDARKKGKGVLFFTGHFGNWEVIAAYFGLVEDRINIVYRTLDNKILDNLASRVRSHTGNALIPKGGAMVRIRELLKDNENIGILIDQNVSWREGVFVDFFGRPASTTYRLASLAMETGAPVLPGFIYRKKDGTYKCSMLKEVELSETGDCQRDIFENTQRYTRIMEEVIREHPEQWFWLHQRWKTKLCQIGGK